MRFFIVLILSYVALLSGCQHFIAKQITKPVKPVIFDKAVVDSNVLGKKTQHCISNKHCVDFLYTSPTMFNNGTEISTVTLNFELKIDSKIKTFEENLNNENKHSVKKNNLIVLFPGYGVDYTIYGMQSRWLAHFTGADVIVAPSPNQNEPFDFGLVNANIVSEYIKIQEYENISLISYSMGAVASSHIKTKLNIDKHILIAPMINFKTALNTIARLTHPTYSMFLGDDYLNEVAIKIIEESGVPAYKLNLFNALSTPSYSEKTYILASNADKVSPYNGLLTLNNPKVSIYEVKDLNHLEMVSLISAQQRNVLLSLLDG
ncbi:MULTISPECIES: hypothetical protein [Pseudoalteromonas]|uniref:hypothetical protein n=1 Tax=Pseudoalteromonas TaxID=53246 RepID=UPI000C348449|nr:MULTISPECIES: hypothetical protein [Pseudoalteromonas]PKG66586.1 hypothetical protein CXF75_03920 [Pseudoalteromonas arctica]PKG71593.1 hypothetical protein CXF64_04890 [Pseudoalteromonas sp. GutCa3]